MSCVRPPIIRECLLGGCVIGFLVIGNIDLCVILRLIEMAFLLLHSMNCWNRSALRHYGPRFRQSRDKAQRQILRRKNLHHRHQESETGEYIHSVGHLERRSPYHALATPQGTCSRGRAETGTRPKSKQKMGIKRIREFI